MHCILWNTSLCSIHSADVLIPGLLQYSGYLVGVRLLGGCSSGYTTATGDRLGETSSMSVSSHQVHICYCRTIVHSQEDLDVALVFNKC